MDTTTIYYVDDVTGELLSTLHVTDPASYLTIPRYTDKAPPLQPAIFSEGGWVEVEDWRGTVWRDASGEHHILSHLGQYPDPSWTRS